MSNYNYAEDQNGVIYDYEVLCHGYYRSVARSEDGTYSWWVDIPDSDDLWHDRGFSSYEEACTACEDWIIFQSV